MPVKSIHFQWLKQSSGGSIIAGKSNSGLMSCLAGKIGKIRPSYEDTTETACIKDFARRFQKKVMPDL